MAGVWRAGFYWMVLVAECAMTLAGCKFPTTVHGSLVLRPGAEGDVRQARIELHDSLDWDGPPVYSAVPDSGGRFDRCTFLFPEVEPGPYFLLAYVDVDSSGTLDDGDIAGVYGGAKPMGSPGNVVMVYKGWTVDVAEIELSEYCELHASAQGCRDEGDSTTVFTYSFNHNVRLTSLDVVFPSQLTLPDASAPGDKYADTSYVSTWTFGSEPTPSGLHFLKFRGTFENAWFQFSVPVRVE